MYKLALLTGLCLSGLFFSRSFAQTGANAWRDSLMQVVQQNARDTNTLKSLSQLYKLHFNEGNYPAALQYCLKALALSKDLHLTEKVPRITYSVGMIYTNLARYDSADHYLDESEALSQSTTDTVLMVQCYNARAMLRNYQSDYSTAVTYLMQSAALLEAAKAPEVRVLIAQTYMNLGNNLIAENQWEKGIGYSKKALTYSNYPDEKRFRVLMHLDIADTYVKLNKQLEAAKYLDSAVQLNRSLNNTAVGALVANTEGAYYEYLHDLSRALEAYQQAYRLCDSTGNDYLKAGIAGNMATIFFTQGNYTAAAQFAGSANTLALASKQYKVAASANDVLQKVAAQQGDYKKALEYASLFKRYADSATNSETQRVTLSLESKYQNQKKESEIASLKTITAEKELSIVKRNRMLIISSLSAAILVLVLGLLYRNSKQKQTIAEKEQRLQQEQIKFLERQQQLVSLQSMLNGQETERTRIAKDLHDGLGGLFSTVKMNFSVLQHENTGLKSDPLFQKSYELVDTASAELRRIAHNMMPEVLMKLGLIQAVQDMCVAVSSSKLLKVSLQAYGMNQRFNAATEIMLYRIIQELINNIIKHAQATQAIIQFNKDGNRLTVTVEDNGRGFNTKEVDAAKHTGMETVKSRVTYLNGNINIDSQNGIGTTVLMEFLVNEEAVSL